MPSLAVLDFDHPEVRIAGPAFADVFIHFSLIIAQRTCRKIEPDPLALAVARRSIKPRLTVQCGHLNEHRARVGIALSDDAREGAADLGPADQGARPKVCFQFVHCRRSSERKNLSLTFRARMRFLILALALGTSTVASATEPNARTAFVERRGLLEADAQCRLFTPDVRSALSVGLAQARGALLRAGWTSARLRELETAAVNAARSRSCTDQRTASAAEDARRAFASWINVSSMEFPGWDRSWRARRVVDDSGWRLSQAIDAPIAATFGVRQRGELQRLTLSIPLARGETGPTSAQLILRDPARAAVREIALPQRISQGLEAGLPSPGATASVPSSRTVERTNGQQFVIFTFPDTAFRNVVTLDPRETIEIRLQQGRSSQRLLVEVGDIAAARAFLTIR